MIHRPKKSAPQPTANPPRLTPSPDGTFASVITDAHDGVWTLGAQLETQRWVDGGFGSLYCWSGGILYVLGTDSRWYRMRPDQHWELYGDTPPIPMPAPDMSPDGTCAFEIVDFVGHHWTIEQPSLATLCDGVWMGEGSGAYYLWYGQAVYVFGVDSQWHLWGPVGWQHYGPEPPIPVTPPTVPPPEPTPPPGVMPTRLYRTSTWEQALCYHGTATPIVLRSITAFALCEQVAHGREAEAIRFLDWCVAHDLNCVRVLVMCSNMFALDPEDGCQALPEVLLLAGERGIYVEVVALADTFAYVDRDWAPHVERVALICVDWPNSLLELVNEPMQSWQYFSPEQLQAYADVIPKEVPWCLGAPDDGHDESTEYYDERASFQTVHTDRARAPWGNVRHIRECQVMSDNIHRYTWNDEPGKEFTNAQQFAIGALARICMIGDTFHSDCVRYAQIPEGHELEWFLARKDGWAFVADTEWGTFANLYWVSPNPEPPIADCDVWDDDGRAYSVLVGETTAYTVLLNARNPVWKTGWTCVRQDERTSRADGQIETGVYELRR